jgi:cystathionine beta-lyase
MKNEFDEVIDRFETHSLKWDAYPADVLPLWVADMDFRAPLSVIKALESRIQHGIFGYESDFENLKQIFIQWAHEHYGWEIHREEILIIPGVVVGLNLVAQSLGRPGDGLLIQPPVYPPFFGVSQHAGMASIEAPLDVNPDGFYGINSEKFESAITPQTRFFILCNPHNPVGRVFSQDELKTIAEICIRRNITIISDEIHCDLIFDGRKHTPIASLDTEIAQRTITLMAPSKTFNIAGLKCSLMIIQNPDLMKQIEKGRKGVVGSPSVLSLEAAHAAYAGGEDWLAELISYLQGNRDFLVSYIKENIPQIRVSSPQGTYLAWLDCRDLGVDQNPTQFFLKNAKVALNDGCAFGTNGEGFTRLNFGCPRVILERALTRMNSAIHKLM